MLKADDCYTHPQMAEEEDFSERHAFCKHKVDSLHTLYCPFWFKLILSQTDHMIIRQKEDQKRKAEFQRHT